MSERGKLTGHEIVRPSTGWGRSFSYSGQRTAIDGAMRGCRISSRGAAARLAAGAVRMCGPIGNRLKRMPDKGWSHEFEDPISLPLPRGRQLTHFGMRPITSRGCRRPSTRARNGRQRSRHWSWRRKVAGPLMHARIGMLRALNHHLGARVRTIAQGSPLGTTQARSRSIA